MSRFLEKSIFLKSVQCFHAIFYTRYFFICKVQNNKEFTKHFICGAGAALGAVLHIYKVTSVAFSAVGNVIFLYAFSRVDID